MAKTLKGPNLNLTKTKLMLKQVILIEKTKFVYKLISSVLADKAVNCYCMEQIEDFSYLVDDLKPEMLLVDYNTASQNWDLFWRSLNASQHQSYLKVLYGEQKDLESFEEKKSFDAVMVKPLDVTTLYEQLSSFKNFRNSLK